MAQESGTRPFGLRDKLGYFFGDFGNDFTFILSTIILMKFYTDVVGISAGAALHVARELSRNPAYAGKKIVALLPDGGDRYLSTWLFEG